jgi:hypothetical protein
LPGLAIFTNHPPNSGVGNAFVQSQVPNLTADGAGVVTPDHTVGECFGFPIFIGHAVRTRRSASLPRTNTRPTLLSRVWSRPGAAQTASSALGFPVDLSRFEPPLRFEPFTNSFAIRVGDIDRDHGLLIPMLVYDAPADSNARFHLPAPNRI